MLVRDLEPRGRQIFIGSTKENDGKYYAGAWRGWGESGEPFHKGEDGKLDHFNALLCLLRGLAEIAEKRIVEGKMDTYYKRDRLKKIISGAGFEVME